MIAETRTQGIAPSGPDASRDLGMTLVEVLIVLAIIAITASVSVLAIGSDDGLRGMAEAKRLEARLQLAADQVMIADMPMAIAIAPDRYGFLERDERSGEWIATDDSALGETFQLPPKMTLRSPGGASMFPLGAIGAGQPFSLELTREGRSWTVAFDGMTARIAPGPQDIAAPRPNL